MQETSFGIPLNTTVTVNADLTGKQKRYIQVRMKQLEEERAKSNDKMTRMWLLKCRDELKYVLQIMETKHG